MHLQKAILYICIFLCIHLAGCNSIKNISSGSEQASEVLNYNLIVYIHGDGDYLYHNSTGQDIQADENALEKAHKTALSAKQGEVFIFHHLPQKKWLGIFPRNSNRLYHYRNGELLNEVSYRLTSDKNDIFETEAELFKEYKSRNYIQNSRSFFAYFGHEIPLFEGVSYHASKPEIPVHTESFIAGVKNFDIDAGSFDLLTLSTCNNGEPQMIAKMNGVADFVLASPQNLHLSHIDTNQFSLLEQDAEISSPNLAEAIATDTFQRLTDSIQTAVTLSIYDVEKIQSYISDFEQHINTYINEEDPNMFNDNIDCEQLSFWNGEEFNTGVQSFFRAAKFGRNSENQAHSGWGCKGK